MSTAVAIVLNYNYGRFLGECLESISAQLHRDLRAIVIDDASTDNSREVIHNWASTTWVPCDVVLKQTNRWPAHSYNLAISRLTDDDYVAVVAAFSVMSPVCAVVYSDTAQFDDISRKTATVPSKQLEEGESTSCRLLSPGSYSP